MLFFVCIDVYVSVVDTEFTVSEDEGALHLCLQVNHTVRTRAVVDIVTSAESATGISHFIHHCLPHYCMLAGPY